MKKNISYLEQVHRDGKIWNYSMAALFFLFPVLLCVIFSVLPDWGGLLKGLIATLPMYWAIGIIEVGRQAAVSGGCPQRVEIHSGI